MSWTYIHPKSRNWYLGWRVGHKLFNRSTGIKATPEEIKSKVPPAEAKKHQGTLDLMTGAKEAGKLTESFYRSLTGQEIVRVAFRAALASFLEQSSLASRSTYASALNGFAEYIHADDKTPDASAVTSDMVQRYLNWKRETTSVSTANNHRKYLRVFFNYASPKYGFQNPVAGVKKMKRTQEEARSRVKRRPFTAAELLKAYAVANDFWRFAMQVAYQTGFRLGMIVTLKRKNVDGDNWQFVGIVDNKHTEGGERTVPIVAKSLRAALGKILSTKGKPDDYIFPDHAKRYLANGSAEFSSEFRKEVLIPAGLATAYTRKNQGNGLTCKRDTNDLTFHSIKHNTVSGMKAGGATQTIAQELVGHDSEAVSRLYTHTSQKQIAQGLKKLPDIFAKAGTKRKAAK